MWGLPHTGRGKPPQIGSAASRASTPAARPLMWTNSGWCPRPSVIRGQIPGQGPVTTRLPAHARTSSTHVLAWLDMDKFRINTVRALCERLHHASRGRPPQNADAKPMQKICNRGGASPGNCQFLATGLKAGGHGHRGLIKAIPLCTGPRYLHRHASRVTARLHELISDRLLDLIEEIGSDFIQIDDFQQEVRR